MKYFHQQNECQKTKIEIFYILIDLFKIFISVNIYLLCIYVFIIGLEFRLVKSNDKGGKICNLENGRIFPICISSQIFYNNAANVLLKPFQKPKFTHLIFISFSIKRSKLTKEKAGEQL